ncbi:uncharacterized protein [Apostichopus japonicus]|uniref:uncharacterized protein isoform X2 n=1 Tax=Stichopus japonicus TaxID=307972 RepID=UPI003AB70801
MDKTFSVKPNSFESLSTWSRVIVLWCCVTSVTASARVDSCYVLGADEEEIEDCDPSIHEVGETVTLHCGEFPPDPPLSEGSSVAWYKDGNLLSNGSLNLTIENVSTASSGDYSCLLNSRSTPSQLVQVKDTSKWKFPAPDCWTRLRGIYNCTWHELTNDEDGIVTYDAFQTRYQWHFTPDNDGTINEVYPIVPDDGSYSVITVNSSSMRYYVTVCAVNCLGHFKSPPVFASEYHNAVPYPPGNVQLSPVSTDQMHVSFDHPVSWNYRHMLYRLKIVTQGDSWNQEKIMVSGDASFTFKVEPGKPYTQVCVKVAAYLELGLYSEDTSPVCHHTNMTAPSSGPPNFNFSSELHDGLSNVTFSWQPLEPDTANGIITNYILIISWNESSCSILNPEHNIPANETKYSVNGLSSYCEYTAELFAENKMGISPPSVITVVGVPYPVNFQTPLRGALIFISFIGLCFVAVRSYLYMKKKLFPDVPEPSHKHRVWNYNMTDPVRHIEQEIFDELHGGLQRGISINTQSSEESECHYQVPSATRALLGSNTTKPSSTVVKKDHYVAMRQSTDPQTAERQSSSTSSSNQFSQSYMTMSPSNSRSQLRGNISKNWKEPAVLYVDLQRSGALQGREAINRDTYGPFGDSSLQDGSEVDSLLQQVENAGCHDDQPIGSHIGAMTSTGDNRISLGQCADGSYLSLSNLQNGKDILLDAYLGEWDACSRVTDFKRMTGDKHLTPVKEDNFDSYVAEERLRLGNQMEKVDEKTKNNPNVQEKSVSEVNGYVPNKQLDTCEGECDAYTREADLKRKTGDNHLTLVKEETFDCYVTEDSLRLGINQMEKVDKKAKDDSSIQEKSVLEVHGYVPNKQLDTCVGQCDAYTREADLKRTTGDNHLIPVKEDNFDCYITEDSLMPGNQMKKLDEKAKTNSYVQEESVLEVNGYVPNKEKQGGYIKVSRCDDPYLVEEFATNCSVVQACSFSDASSVQSSEPLYSRCN